MCNIQYSAGRLLKNEINLKIEYWVFKLFNNQCTAGRCIGTTKRGWPKKIDQPLYDRFFKRRTMYYAGVATLLVAHSIKISATSGRENSDGGLCPLASISLTFVPLKETISGFLGAVLLLAMLSVFLHQKVFSNFNICMPILGPCTSISSCASYVP